MWRNTHSLFAFSLPSLSPLSSSQVGVEMDHFPFANDIEFTKQLVREKSVFCLPGDVRMPL